MSERDEVIRALWDSMLREAFLEDTYGKSVTRVTQDILPGDIG